MSANDSTRTVACGYNAAAIEAVTSSSSTPTISAEGGASPMNVPEPAPGSCTLPLANPSPSIRRHMWLTISGSV